MGEPAIKVITFSGTHEEFMRLVREAVRAELESAPPAPPEKAYTTKEAAEYLRMSPNALRHHIRAGNIVPDTFGKRGRTSGHRFSRATLDAFLGGKGGGK